MKVSIITVCRNAEATLETTVQSVVNQTYGDIEYIVIDGESEDCSRSIVERYRDRIATIICEGDRGIYDAMNKGIRLATGDFLYFLNADDYLFDNSVIQDLVSFVGNQPECDFVYGDHEARFVTGAASIHCPAAPEQMLEEMVCLGECLIQPASFFKAALFQRLGLFNERYRIASDYEWFSRLLQDSSLTLCYYPRTLVSYAHGGASSHIRALFSEVFEIQNTMRLYQQEPWLSKRLLKLQQSFIDKYEALESNHQLANARKVHIDGLEAQVAGLHAEIEAMKSSKFWKIRQAWIRLKQSLGLSAT